MLWKQNWMCFTSCRLVVACASLCSVLRALKPREGFFGHHLHDSLPILSTFDTVKHIDCACHSHDVKPGGLMLNLQAPNIPRLTFMDPEDSGSLAHPYFLTDQGLFGASGYIIVYTPRNCHGSRKSTVCRAKTSSKGSFSASMIIARSADIEPLN